MKSAKKLSANELYALAFGLFLGLCLLKFGNPVILDKRIFPPNSLSEYWNDAWPIQWANWFLLPLAAIGVMLFAQSAGTLPRRQYSPWLLVLPLVWLGWQTLSALPTVDAHLTTVTLRQFCGCVSCYYLGLFLFRSPRALPLLLAGLLAAFTICLIRAVHQHVEFPRNQQVLQEGQRTGWTNFPPDLLLEMKRDQTIITTNGVDVINPMLVSRFGKNRVMGTLVYPNALAGVILLLFPVSFVLAYYGTKKLKPLIHGATVGLTVFMSALAFIWSGSKFGWLLAMLMGGLCLFRLHWPLALRILTIVIAIVLGLGIFAIRFHTYFQNGATSTTARFDYWHAAVQTTAAHPWFGTGPGTFQRPYAQLKSPDAEMSRLTHNDYLEQFSDSGIPGGLAYAAWIVAALVSIGRNLWNTRDPVILAIFLGVLGWFIQGIGEFSLYIPALAWTAFILLGWAVALGKVPTPQLPLESIRQKPARG